MIKLHIKNKNQHFILFIRLMLHSCYAIDSPYVKRCHSLLLYVHMHLIRFRKKNMTKFCLICMCFSFFFVACSVRKKGLTAKCETLTKKLWISSCLAHIIWNTEKISRLQKYRLVVRHGVKVPLPVCSIGNKTFASSLIDGTYYAVLWKKIYLWTSVALLLKYFLLSGVVK